MNSWKFNSTANYTMKCAIANCLNVSNDQVYKLVKTFSKGEVLLKDGRKLKLVIDDKLDK